jgi:hypothetical protein
MGKGPIPTKRRAGAVKRVWPPYRFEGVPKQSLSHARTALAFAPDLVDEVKTGQTSLADAYKTAQDRKKAKVSLALALKARGRPDASRGNVRRLMVVETAACMSVASWLSHAAAHAD